VRDFKGEPCGETQFCPQKDAQDEYRGDEKGHSHGHGNGDHSLDHGNERTRAKNAPMNGVSKRKPEYAIEESSWMSCFWRIFSSSVVNGGGGC
jgi:hypothetical protein